MISLRENIDKVKFTDPITARVLVVAGENCQIARQRGGVAREINNLLRSDLDQDAPARARPRPFAAGRARLGQAARAIAREKPPRWYAANSAKRRRSPEDWLSRSRAAASFDSTAISRSKRFASGTLKSPTPANKSSASFPRASPITVRTSSSRTKAIHLKEREMADAIVVRRRRDT